MGGRKKRISDDAEGTTVYLTPDEQVVLRVILARRKKRGDQRSSINEIIVDGIWKVLVECEQVTREQIDALLKMEKENRESAQSRITAIRK